MSEEKVTVCDVCGKKGTPTAGSPWAHLSTSTGWYGPHPYLTGPGFPKNDSTGRSDDVCSAECALAWLNKRIERIKENVESYAEDAARRAKYDADRKLEVEREAAHQRKAILQPTPPLHLGCGGVIRLHEPTVKQSSEERCERCGIYGSPRDRIT